MPFLVTTRFRRYYLKWYGIKIEHYDISLPKDHWKNMPMVSFDFCRWNLLFWSGNTRNSVHKAYACVLTYL